MQARDLALAGTAPRQAMAVTVSTTTRGPLGGKTSQGTRSRSSNSRSLEACPAEGRQQLASLGDGASLARGGEAAGHREDRDRTGEDRVRTGEDRVRTGEDRVRTGEDRDKTGEDRDKTGGDRDKTGGDRDKTGEDRDRDRTGEDVARPKEDRGRDSEGAVGGVAMEWTGWAALARRRPGAGNTNNSRTEGRAGHGGRAST